MSRRTGLTDSALVRLLARLTDITVPESRQGFADRLSQWFGWTDAISLSAALDGSAAAPAARARPGRAERTRSGRRAGGLGEGHRRTRRLCVRFRARTVGATWPGNRRWRRPSAPCAAGCARGSRPRRPRWPGCAAWTSSWSRCSVRRSSRLLATVPGLLEKHFERLRQAAEARRRRATARPARPPGWTCSASDMQGVLLRRTRYSIATGRRAARSPSREPTRQAS